jgi:transcriptional regulator with XRE-family HTH domain
MITAAQLRAARALLGIGQAELAERAGLSVPTIQRMEASIGDVRGIVDTLVKVVRALDEFGVELIGENAPSAGVGRGVRLKSVPSTASAPKPAPTTAKPRPKARA